VITRRHDRCAGSRQTLGETAALATGGPVALARGRPWRATGVVIDGLASDGLASGPGEGGPGDRRPWRPAALATGGWTCE
jgi:hypothetical protein